ncbi:MAG: hypothetical protein HOI34_05215 [Rhodospirillaceae bacterium]|jgi:hypothetical protein|nr:hypothetical protein [Rhodospirillaceae bacterium]MBT6203081.1 hypothetical protein [Rhodospirillaceae bacterium]MBT6508884.1 hypothetical protein [Rhodospirillaceae bacterium]MBT7612011.1 hypothetical protein [Rhodospirillaceae bacterium]MBT7645938.1 hypothetical protein [Rhodospirillaceae bacterium]
MKLKRLPASAGKEAILEAMRAEGGLIVEEIFDPATVASMWDELADKRVDHWMNTAQFIGIRPGEPAQELHRDNENWQCVCDWA